MKSCLILTGVGDYSLIKDIYFYNRLDIDLMQMGIFSLEYANEASVSSTSVMFVKFSYA